MIPHLGALTKLTPLGYVVLAFGCPPCNTCVGVVQCSDTHVTPPAACFGQLPRGVLQDHSSDKLVELCFSCSGEEINYFLCCCDFPSIDLRSSEAALIMLSSLVLLVLVALPPSVRSVSVKRILEVEPPKEGGKEVIDHLVEVDEGESVLLQAATYPLSGQLESMTWSMRGREIFRCRVLRTFSFS